MFLVILITKLEQEFVYSYIDYKARTRVFFLIILITRVYFFIILITKLGKELFFLIILITKLGQEFFLIK